MIFAGLLAGYATLLCGGFGVTLFILRGRARINLAECCCLSWVFGTGMVSLLLWVLGTFCSGSLLVAVVTAGGVGVGLIGAGMIGRSGAKLFLPIPRNPLEWILLGILMTQIGIMFWIAMNRTLGWDGLVMWESKARFAFLSHNVLPAHYYNSGRGLTHPEYPLGIPLTELWLYIWMGEAHQLWLKTLFPVFYAVGVVQLAIISARLTARRWVGGLAAVLFFFVPHETVGGGSATIGYVDFPLSILYLTVVGYLLLALKDNSGRSFLVYLVSLALLPWFKREGAILWLIAALAGAAFIFMRRKHRLWLLALLPGAFVVLGWSIYLRAIHADIPHEFVPVTFANLMDNAGRFIPIWQALLSDATNQQAWGLFWLLAVIATASLFGRFRQMDCAILLWSVLIPVLAYSSIYIFSAAPDYVVHIKLSLPRLLMQVVPALWIAIAWAFARPWGRAENRAHAQRP